MTCIELLSILLSEKCVNINTLVSECSLFFSIRKVWILIYLYLNVVCSSQSKRCEHYLIYLHLNAYLSPEYISILLSEKDVNVNSFVSECLHVYLSKKGVNINSLVSECCLFFSMKKLWILIHLYLNTWLNLQCLSVFCGSEFSLSFSVKKWGY